MADAAAVTNVETDTGDAGDSGDAATVLTGDASTEGEGTTTNSDAGGETSGDDAGNSDEGQGEGDAGTEGSQTVPDTYADFAMPEGVELNETALADASPLFKELNLTQDQAQKVIDLYAKQVQAGSQNQADAFTQLKSDWFDQSKNDCEFGGDKFEENVKVAQSAITKYGTPELKQLLEEHGVGNHPELIRFMVRVGRTLGEDVPGGNGSAPSKAKDRVAVLYPNI